MVSRTSIGLSLGFVLFSCGHSGTEKAVSVPSAPPTVTSSVASPAPSAAAAVSAPPAAKQTDVGKSPSPAVSTAPVTSDVEEKLPSGVAFRQAAVGGPAPGPELPQGTTVLHIGDSFAGALGIELNKVLDALEGPAAYGLVGDGLFCRSPHKGRTWAHRRERIQQCFSGGDAGGNGCFGGGLA